MKMNRVLIGLALAAGSMLTGCLKNNEIDHPDFAYQTVYFGSQFPIRTLELGEDLFIDNSLDNQRKVTITATTGGVRENQKDISVTMAVDTALLTRMYFPSDKGGAKVLPLPSTYYKLSGNEIMISKGNFTGGVQMELTDAAFR